MTIYTAIFTTTDNHLSTTNSPNNLTTNSSTNNVGVIDDELSIPPLATILLSSKQAIIDSENQASITEINPVNTTTSLSQTTPTPPSSSPKKVVKRVRDKSLKIRLSEPEYQQLLQKVGNESLAAFMRDYCLAAPDYRPKQPATVPKIDPALLRILAGASNNLNQIAKHLNQQAARNQTVQIAWAAFELAKVADSLWRIEHAS